GWASPGDEASRPAVAAVLGPQAPRIPRAARRPAGGRCGPRAPLRRPRRSGPQPLGARARDRGPGHRDPGFARAGRGRGDPAARPAAREAMSTAAAPAPTPLSMFTTTRPVLQDWSMVPR